MGRCLFKTIYMRKIELQNEELAQILNDRVPIHKNIGLINEKLVKLDKERQKDAYKMERLKEKTRVILDKITPDFNLTEFEVITNVGLNENKQPEVTIIDQIEEFTKPKEEKEIEEYKQLIRDRAKENALKK
jgi:hypothetical protein